MQIARPPAFLFHVNKALHRHLAAVGVAAANLEIARPNAVFRAPFHLEGVPARTKFKYGLAGNDDLRGGMGNGNDGIIHRGQGGGKAHGGDESVTLV